jgi:outer membrane protein assembly factor BamE (lipoprotein component of BamABCDE complex)
MKTALFAIATFLLIAILSSCTVAKDGTVFTIDGTQTAAVIDAYQRTRAPVTSAKQPVRVTR